MPNGKEKKTHTQKKVVKMPNLKNNPIMNSQAQEILFVSNAGIQMKRTERKLPNTECSWKRW